MIVSTPCGIGFAEDSASLAMAQWPGSQRCAYVSSGDECASIDVMWRRGVTRDSPLGRRSKIRYQINNSREKAMHNRSFFFASMLSVAVLVGVLGCSDQPAEVAGKGGGKPAAEIRIESWGPQETTAGKSFNVQPSGKSAIWIKVTGQNPSAGIQVLFGDKQLDDVVASDQLVTAAVPAALIEQPSEQNVVIVETATKRRTSVGTFKILPKEGK